MFTTSCPLLLSRCFPRFCQATGDWAGAGALYHRALELHPSSPELLSNFGWLQESTGGGSRDSLESAAALYAQALAAFKGVEPSNARRQVEINLANVRAKLERLAK